jgi:hypothetical protein
MAEPKLLEETIQTDQHTHTIIMKFIYIYIYALIICHFDRLMNHIDKTMRINLVHASSDDPMGISVASTYKSTNPDNVMFLMISDIIHFYRLLLCVQLLRCKDSQRHTHIHYISISIYIYIYLYIYIYIYI